MKTIWDWSLKSEAERITYACTNTANGFYGNQGYLVLPSPSHDTNPKTSVYLPSLHYDTIPRFWDRVSKLNMDKADVKETNPFILPLSTMLAAKDLKSPANHALESIWSKHGQKIFTSLCSILNRSSSEVKTLYIHWSHFGTNASFVAPHRFPSDLHLYLRYDAGLHTLVETLVTAFMFHQLRDNFNATWKQIKLVSDWVVQDSVLSTTLTKLDPAPYSSTLQSLSNSKISKDSLLTSTNFLHSIHCPSQNSKFQNIHEHIYYNHKLLLHFTQRETLVIQELVKNTPTPVSLDNISDLIFSNPETDFSLYTITKLIEHIRNKLEKNGISSSRLKTHYGKGYSIQ